MTQGLDMRFVSGKFCVTYFFKEPIVYLCQIKIWAVAPSPKLITC